MKLRWLGNSCVEIMDDKHILIDPNYIEEPKSGVEIVLVTHEHSDHFDKEKFERLGAKKVIAPKATLEEYNIEGIVAKPGMEIEGIKVLESWCWKAKESCSYYYKGILHSGDSARFPDVDGVKVVFTACFPDFYDEYVKEFRRLKPKLIIPIHYSMEKIRNAEGLKEILDKEGFNCRILSVGEEIEV